MVSVKVNIDELRRMRYILETLKQDQGFNLALQVQEGMRKLTIYNELTPKLDSLFEQIAQTEQANIEESEHQQMPERQKYEQPKQAPKQVLQKPKYQKDRQVTKEREVELNNKIEENLSNDDAEFELDLPPEDELFADEEK